jgi:sterol desaturase/sphingolipid hydroxylase (fatty acid hydroxylase superfamily)
VIEHVFVTPSHHRVHHGANPRYIDRNFGGLLIIWDRIFGTFAEEIEPVVYGVDEELPTANPIKIQLSPLKLFFRR